MNDTDAQELIKLRKENAYYRKHTEYVHLMLECVGKVLAGKDPMNPKAWYKLQGECEVYAKLIENLKREYDESCK